ncbi:MAG: hypothetical protein AB8G99_24045 [Planctomycetaceae bacterium]
MDELTEDIKKLLTEGGKPDDIRAKLDILKSRSKHLGDEARALGECSDEIRIQSNITIAMNKERRKADSE